MELCGTVKAKILCSMRNLAKCVTAFVLETRGSVMQITKGGDRHTGI